MRKERGGRRRAALSLVKRINYKSQAQSEPTRCTSLQNMVPFSQLILLPFVPEFIVVWKKVNREANTALTQESTIGSASPVGLDI